MKKVFVNSYNLYFFNIEPGIRINFPEERWDLNGKSKGRIQTGFDFDGRIGWKKIDLLAEVVYAHWPVLLDLLAFHGLLLVGQDIFLPHPDFETLVEATPFTEATIGDVHPDNSLRKEFEVILEHQMFTSHQYNNNKL